MKTELVIASITQTLAATVAQRRFVGFAGDYPAANGKALGVSGDAGESGESIPVITHGVVLVEASGAISVGGAVAADTSGKAKAATAVSITVPSGATPVTSDAAQPNLVEAGGVLPQAVNGYALDEAAADGDLIRVRLN